MAKKWTKFPHADAAYTYAGPALKKAWGRLHQGDREAFPKDAAVADAWRQFHAGAFQEAVTAGRAAGEAGINAAVKAQCVYANYVEPDAKARLALFEEAAQWADVRRAAAPRDANAHYLYAFALGRYGQGISVEPRHAEAAAAYGAYQSEVIDKVGGIVAGLTYGAKKDSALKSFEQAIKLFPESAIVHIEYANGLILLFGKSRIDDATRLYETAAAAKQADAMERLDVELAKSELE